MAKRNEKVFDKIMQRVAKDPSVPNEKLREVAVKMDKSIDKLTPRQFHAVYALPAKRRTKSDSAPREAKATTPVVERDDNVRGKVRDLLLTFAREVASADSKEAIVRVVGEMDEYVDRALEIVRGS